MSINKDFFVPTQDIDWQGKVACTVRGITPNDLTQIMSEHAADVETLMTIFEGDKALQGIDPNDAAAVQAAVAANSARLFSTLMTAVPALAAKLIAIACDDRDLWEFVRDKYPLPLQFEAVSVIAKLTFVDTNGFKAFLGNVMALAGNLGNDQRRPAPSQAAEIGTPG